MTGISTTGIVRCWSGLIVVEQSSRLGLKVSFVDHLKVGVPVTLATLGFSGLWIWGLVTWVG